MGVFAVDLTDKYKPIITETGVLEVASDADYILPLSPYENFFALAVGIKGIGFL